MMADKKARIYFSVPIGCSWSLVQEYERKFKGMHVLINYWDRGQCYDSNIFNSADAVVIFTEYNYFNTSLGYLPSGVAGELKRAVAANKKIYLAYQNASGDCNIYDVDVSLENGISLRGIAGSSKTYTDLHNDIMRKDRYGNYVEDTNYEHFVKEAKRRQEEEDRRGRSSHGIIDEDDDFFDLDDVVKGDSPDRRVLLLM